MIDHRCSWTRHLTGLVAYGTLVAAATAKFVIDASHDANRSWKLRFGRENVARRLHPTEIDWTEPIGDSF